MRSGDIPPQSGKRRPHATAPTRILSVLFTSLCILASCGESKKPRPPVPPVPPPVDTPALGASTAGTPTALLAHSATQILQDIQRKNDTTKRPAPPFVSLLRPGVGGNQTLHKRILGSFKSAGFRIHEFSPAEFKRTLTSDFSLVVATISPTTPANLHRHFRRITHSPAKLILVGTPGKIQPPCTTLIRPDDRAIGTAAGSWVIAEFARQAERRGRASITGNVVQIRASDDDPASALRHDGFLDVVDRHAGVIFVHDGPGFWREADAKKRMEEALRIQKDIRAVFAHSDPMARGAREAIRAFERKHPDAPEIAIIGGGGSDDFDASIPLDGLVAKAADIASRLLSDPGFRPPSEIAVPVDLSPPPTGNP